MTKTRKALALAILAASLPATAVLVQAKHTKVPQTVATPAPTPEPTATTTPDPTTSPTPAPTSSDPTTPKPM